jgi:uncharacterized repeat protein (TIGR04076 family)
MVKPGRVAFQGNKIVATVKSVKGTCSWGHEAGDIFEVDCHDAAGLCGFLYHDVFPYLVMLQFGGSFPAEWGDQDTVTCRCMDRAKVTVELHRFREKK